MTNDTQKLDNINFIKHLNRMMLEEAEEAIVCDLPGDELPVIEKDKDNLPPDPYFSLRERLGIMKKNIVRRRVRMFGAKKAIVTVVGEIADTEIKLAKQQPASATPPPPLDPREMELLREFVATPDDGRPQ